MREHQKLLRELKKGDRILTNGGIYGTIVNLKGNILEVKIAEEIKIELTRSAVAEVIGSEEQATT